MKNNLKGSIILILTALIWGIAFVAQSVGMQYIGPFTYQATRSLIGFLVMIPVVLIFGRNDEGKDRSLLLQAGLVCGLIFSVASNLQQYGLQYTTVGKAGFLTALYIIIVPVIGLFRGKKPAINLWIAIFIALAGMYLLCMNEELKFSAGDIYVILCALVFSFHILAIDYYAPKVNLLKLSLLQYLVCAVVSGILTILFEPVSFSAILSCWLPLLYGGIMSVGVGYTLQLVGQKYTEPTLASLLMCFEAVFSLLAGIVFMKQIPSLRELIGCLLMFIAIIIAQIPFKTKRETQN